MTPLILSKFGIWTLTTVDYISLIAATTNAFNGALLARRPDHYKHFTVIGIIILAYAGGIGGGIVRDVLVNKVPAPLENPWYLIACTLAAALALLIDYQSGQRFKDGLFQFMTAFSLPWYAIVGVQAALGANLGYAAAVLIGIIATTAGRWLIDVACNVVPKQLVRGEFFVTAAALTGIAYLLCSQRSGFRFPSPRRSRSSSDSASASCRKCWVGKSGSRGSPLPLPKARSRARSWARV